MQFLVKTSIQCFDTISSVSRRASSLDKNLVAAVPRSSFLVPLEHLA